MSSPLGMHGRVNSANPAACPHDDTPHAADRTSTSPAKQGPAPPAVITPASPRLRWCPAKPFNTARFADYLSVSLAARQLTNGGPLQQVLANKLAGLTGSGRPIIPAASGTAALHALAAGWALHRGRPLTWATQAFTFPTSFQGPLAGAVVLDLDPTHWGPSLAGLDACGHTIDGVIVTNVFGHQADVAAYEAWCTAHGKLLLFDNAATATGRLPDGRCVHDAGDGAIISLHETKPLGRGEGGAIIAPSDTIARAVNRAMNFGFDIPAGHRVGDRLASNYRMSDVAAAAALDHLDTVIGKDWVGVVARLTKHACARLRQAGFDAHLPLLHDRGALHACLFVKLPPGLAGESVCEALCSLPSGAVEAKQYYRPLVDREATPVAWQVYDQCVCLPLHVDMSSADVEYMCSALAGLVDKENCARAA